MQESRFERVAEQLGNKKAIRGVPASFRASAFNKNVGYAKKGEASAILGENA